MAIQNRRGVYADFDPTKLMPGEFAVVMEDDPDGTSGAAVYMCFGNGVVKRLIGATDLQAVLAVFNIDWNNVINTPSAYPSLWEYISNHPAIEAGTGYKSTLEGGATESSDTYTHAEGYQTKATVDYAHAEGDSSQANGVGSHAEGWLTKANAHSAHSEGHSTQANAADAHAEGLSTVASGYNSHSEGWGTVANHQSQHASGEWNIEDDSTAENYHRGNYVEIVGNGTASNARSNARTLDWSGNEVLAGKLTLGAGPTANMDAATKQYVDNAVGGVSQVAFSDPNSDGNIVISFT